MLKQITLCLLIFTVATCLQAADKTIELQPLAVTGTAASVYTPTPITSATLTPTPMIELPQSMEVLTDAFLQEQGVSDYRQALQYVAGVFSGGDSPLTRTAGQSTMRGFSGSDTTVNGFVLPKIMPIYLDAGFIRQVEVFRGPVASIEGGQTSSLGPYGAGGSINIVTKSAQPQAAYSTDFLAEMGESQHYRLTGDLNQPMNSINTLARLALAAETVQPFYLPDSLDWGWNLSAAPSLQWKPCDKLTLQFDATLQKLDMPAYQGIPYLQGKFITDIDTYYGNEDSRDKYFGLTTQLRGEWKFTESLKLRGGFSYARAELDYKRWGVKTGPPRGMTTKEYYDQLVETGQGQLAYSSNDSTYQNYGSFAHLFAEGDLGTTHHQLVLGADMLRKQSDFSSESGTTEEVDLNDPTVEIPSSLTSGKSFSRVDRYGLLLQDQVRWKSFHLLLGGRIDRHESDQDNEGTSYSPRVGLTWMLTERLALYGNYSHAEAPNFGYNGEDGKELTDSWKVNQYEAGIKANVFADLFATVAFFELQQENTPIAVEDLVLVYESGGKNESKGIEATISGNITPEWSCRLSYTYIDYKNLDTDQNYDRFPPNSLALWTAYRFLDGSLRGLQLGGGYRYAESYVTTFRGAYIGPEYVIGSHNVFDVIADYELPTALPGMEKTIVSFGIKNIFNEEYAESVRHAPQAFPGEPRTFLVSLRGSF